MQMRHHDGTPAGGAQSATLPPRRRKRDLEDVLSAAADRPELERLFDRRVRLQEILRLAGRGVSSSRILDLLESPDLHREVRRLLGS